MRLIDADKVVEQLEEERDYSYANFEKYAEEYGVDKEGNWHFEGLKRAIEIVKGGGTDAADGLVEESVVYQDFMKRSRN